MPTDPAPTEDEIGPTHPLTQRDASTFLRAIHTAPANAATTVATPEEVIRLIDTHLQPQVRQLAADLAAVRASAFNELLRTSSAAEVAARFGISRQAIQKLLRSTPPADIAW